MKLYSVLLILITNEALARSLEDAASSFTTQASSIAKAMLIAPFLLGGILFSSGLIEWGKRVIGAGAIAVAIYYGFELFESTIKGIVS